MNARGVVWLVPLLLLDGVPAHHGAPTRRVGPRVHEPAQTARPSATAATPVGPALADRLWICERVPGAVMVRWTGARPDPRWGHSARVWQPGQTLETPLGPVVLRAIRARSVEVEHRGCVVRLRVAPPRGG